MKNRDSLCVSATIDPVYNALHSYLAKGMEENHLHHQMIAI